MRFLRFSVLIQALTILTKDKIILGIDPGTNILGYGVIRVDSKGPHYETMGVFDLRKIKEPFEKLANIFSGVNELIAEYAPDELAVESPFYGKNAQVILKLGRAQGAAITAAVMHGIPVTEYAPRKVKISVTGNGNATKEQVAAMLKTILKFDTLPLKLDATDGLAVAMCHYYDSLSLKTTKSGQGWADFIRQNPDRVKK